MPVRTVQVVEDSIDGKPLPEDTAPLTISLDRKSWSLYLSDQNRKKVLDQIEKWTANEPESRATEFAQGRKTRPAAKSDPEQLAAIRSWASENGFTVAPKGRIAAHIQEAYNAAH
jgi:hypothetical protein